MYTINGLPYIDLSTNIDLSRLISIQNEIVFGIVKSRELITEGGASSWNCLNRDIPSIVDILYNSNCTTHIHNKNGLYYEFYKKLNFVPRDCVMFAKYVGEYQQMGQILFLRTHDLIEHKSLPDCHDTLAYINFPSLRKWITDCKVFDKVGRILFFLNSPNELHSIHLDTFTGSPDNFIIINLNPHLKELSVYGDKKYVIGCKVSVFDTRNYHGTIGNDFPSWTLRIDGKFNKAWAESAGIWDYFSN